MMLLSPEQFYFWKDPRIIIDLRPAGAFRKGSFPHALSLPLESEDAFISTIEQLKGIKETGPVHIVDVDGKFSASIAEHVDVFALEGGYRRYKEWREKVFCSGPPLLLVGGKTGSGKTEILQGLKHMHCQVLDLEALAAHKGSVFGNLIRRKQPTHEDFHNALLALWLSFDPGRPVWTEEKNHIIGSVGIPEGIYDKMSCALLLEPEVPFEERLRHISEEYDPSDDKAFAEAISKLESRMGMSQMHKALHYHVTGQMEKCFALLLNYYDKAYESRRTQFHRGDRRKVRIVDFEKRDMIAVWEKEAMDRHKKENPAD